MVAGAIAALLVGAAVAWWLRPGAELTPVGNALFHGDVPVGQAVFVGYPLTVRGGDVEIDDVSMGHAPERVSASFSIDSPERCAVGLLLKLPSSCDPVPVAGQRVGEGGPRMLIARYVLTGATIGDGVLGDVVVTFHEGRRGRTVNLGMRVCLSTTSVCDRSAA